MSDRSRTFLGAVFLVVFSARASAQSPQPLPAGALTLEQVLELAETRSESVGIARRGVERAQGEQVRARSGRFPQLNASAAYERALASEFADIFGGTSGPGCPPFTLSPDNPLDQRVAEIERAIDCGAVGNSFFGGTDGDEDGGALPFGRTNTWRVNLSFAQAVYTGGRQSAQEAVASAARQNADLAVDSARAQLMFEATRAYYDAALSDRLVNIAEATLAQADATVRQVQATFEAGSQPEFELLRARVNRDNQRPAVIRQRASRDIAMLRLKQLLDLPASFELRIAASLDLSAATPPAAFASRLPRDSETAAGPIAERTAVREAAAHVRLREATLRLARSDRFPSLSLTSNYSRVAYPSETFPTGNFRTNWTVGANVQMAVLTGGRQRGTEAVARAEVEQSRLQLQQVHELAVLDAQSALAELAAARAAFDASAGTIEQAARAYEIAEVRFRSGVSTQLELSDARLLLQQAEANRAQTARDLQVARARVALLPDLPLGAVTGSVLAAGAPQNIGVRGGNQ